MELIYLIQRLVVNYMPEIVTMFIILLAFALGFKVNREIEENKLKDKKE